MEAEGVLERVRRNEAGFRERIEGLRDIPIVGDVRGAGYFLALELVRDQQTGESFTHEEAEELLRDFLSPRIYDLGLICRADDRGDPVVQLSPPLIAGDAEFDRIEATLRTALSEASERFGSVGPHRGGDSGGSVRGTGTVRARPAPAEQT
jgi:adenosylmethionine-8-amino-7-oxononanoate aminotransferase